MTPCTLNETVLPDTVLISFEKQYVKRPSLSAVNEYVPVSRRLCSANVCDGGPSNCAPRLEDEQTRQGSC